MFRLCPRTGLITGESLDLHVEECAHHFETFERASASCSASPVVGPAEGPYHELS